MTEFAVQSPITATRIIPSNLWAGAEMRLFSFEEHSISA